MYGVKGFLLAGVLLPAVAVAATRIEPHEVAEPLRPWVAWVLSQHPDANCPFHFNHADVRRCAWPGRLTLSVAADGGAFDAAWEVFAPSWVALPGERDAWPQDVRIDGVPAAVVNREGRPAVRVAAGSYRIQGQFAWSRVPESLSVPADTGLVQLQIGNRVIGQPEIDDKGQLWLRDPGRRGDTADGAERNQLVLTVARHIVDDNPLEIHTRIELDVAGEPREQTLGIAVPQGFIPVAVTGGLPARLDADGTLTAQLRPGRHVVTVRARHPDPIVAIAGAAQPAPWPSTETWVFEARNHLRIVEVEGVTSVDPRQTRVPDEWRHLPAFAVAPGDVMRLVVTRRGDPDPEPDKLELARELWLDFDGGGYTTHDVITGQVTREWRLDSGDALRLGQVVLDGQPQFITRLTDGGAAGVEVRRGNVDLRADGRMEPPVDSFPATGWAHDFQRVTALVRLPPGWDVFAVRGVDNVPDTWLSRWTLLDLFLVLVIAASVSRLWHWRAACLALVAMTLIWHAPEAPRFVWIHLLVAIALWRVLPAGRVRSLVGFYRDASALVLVLIALPFIVQQLRVAMYPQLSQPIFAPQPALPADLGMKYHRIEPAVESDSAELDFAEAMQADAPASTASTLFSLKAGGNAGGDAQLRDLYRFDPNAVVQTGPGLPTWRWRELRLDWNGPVARTQELAIRYIPPRANAVLNVARVGLLLAFLAVLSGITWARVRAMTARAGTPVLVLLAGIASSAGNTANAAGFPDPAMLGELEQRLLAPPDCNPQCAEIARMRVDVSRAAVSIRIEIHAAEATAVALPGNARGWLPETVLLNDAPARVLARDPKGTLWLQIAPGVHDAVLRGALPTHGSVQIALPQRPRFTEVATADGWRVEGLRDNGLTEAQLQLTRTGDASPTPRAGRFEKTTLPPFVRVERTVVLDLDWTTTTRVTRVVGGDNAVVLEVPLLDGESVVTPGVDTHDGRVRVNLPQGQHAMQWQSVLTRRDAIELVAPATTAWSETWRLRAGPVWHASLSGIAPVHHRGDGNHWLPEWRPWPGESVTIAVTRPHGIGGQTITIDASTLQIRPGKRATETKLEISLRSSQGGQHTLGLPDMAQLQQVRINDVPQPIREDSGRLTLPISPGAQRIAVEWRNETGIVPRFRTPAIDLGIPSINHEIKLLLGPDRWTLFTLGPRLGPAVLFWSLLAALLIVAVALSRDPLTPLRLHEWLLLAIGLSQVFLPLAVLVVLWLFALGARERHGTRASGATFNLMQIGLALLSVAALLVFVEAIRHGLLGHPDMHVSGNGSSAQELTWYADRVASNPPTATAITVPLFVYRVLMLAWALWLALAVVRWLRWGWTCYAAGGLWQAWRRPRPPAAAETG